MTGFARSLAARARGVVGPSGPVVPRARRAPRFVPRTDLGLFDAPVAAAPVARSSAPLGDDPGRPGGPASRGTVTRADDAPAPRAVRRAPGVGPALPATAGAGEAATPHTAAPAARGASATPDEARAASELRPPQAVAARPSELRAAEPPAMREVERAAATPAPPPARGVSGMRGQTADSRHTPADGDPRERRVVPGRAEARVAPRPPAATPVALPATQVAPAAPPRIEVHIGRVEVRPPRPAAAPARTHRAAAPPRPAQPPAFGELSAARRHVDRIAR